MILFSISVLLSIFYRLDYLSEMNVPDHGISVRSRAIGMIEGGLPQKKVALRLEVEERSVRRWWHNHRTGTSMETKPRSGRPKRLIRLPKLIINKSMGK